MVEVFVMLEDILFIFEKKYVIGWNRKFVMGYFVSYYKIFFVLNKDGFCILKWCCVINVIVYMESRWMVILYMILWCLDLFCVYYCNLIFYLLYVFCF